jgi:hypothetical protein
MILFTLLLIVLTVVLAFAAVVYKAFKVGNNVHRKLNLWLKN